MKKNIVSSVLVILLLLSSLSACNKTNNQIADDYPQSSEPTTNQMTNTTQPTPTTTLAEPIKIAYADANQKKSAAVTDKGDLYIWGDGESRPIKVMENIKSVSLGNDFVMVLTNNGEVFAWGKNDKGQIGSGDTESQLFYEEPVKIMENVKQIDAGASHALAISETGDLYVWGDNILGEVGNGLAQMGKGTISANKETVPVKIMEDVKQASAGLHVTLAVTENGDLFAWGWNDYGTIGNGEFLEEQGQDIIVVLEPLNIMSNVKSVEIEFLTAAAVTEDNELYIWGDNRHIKINTKQDSNNDSEALDGILPSPIKIMDEVEQFSFGGINFAYIDVDANLFVFKENVYGLEVNNQPGDLKFETEEPTVNEPQKVLGNIVQVCSSAFYTMAITEDGLLYSWGNNEFGQLGNGKKGDQDILTIDCFEALPVLIEFDPYLESELDNN